MINNIFTALAREKTPGAIMEFVLWCAVCFVVLMSLIALAVGNGHVVWILMILFSAGLAVLMAFRLKAIAMLYSVCVFYAIMFLVHYLCLGLVVGSGESPAVVSTILFVLTLMLSLAVVICAFIQFFSRFRLGTVLTVLVLADSEAILLMQILMYTSEFTDAYMNAEHQIWMNARGYWIGTAGYWGILAVTSVFYACFFWGPIDSRKEKIIMPGGMGKPYGTGSFLGLQGTYGFCTGRMFYLQGRTLTLGSGQGVDIPISDAYVSKVHCAVRFNTTMGFYEVWDQSANGVFLSNGTRLQKGTYNSVRRGSILCIGSQAQQFRLM